MDHDQLTEIRSRVFRLFVIAICGLGLLTCASPMPSALAAGETFKAPIPKPAGQPSQQPPQKIELQAEKKPGKQAELNFEYEMKRLNALINLQNNNIDALFNRAWLYESMAILMRLKRTTTVSLRSISRTRMLITTEGLFTRR